MFNASEDKLSNYKIKKFIIFINGIFFFVGIILFFFGCSGKTWKDHGDSCILISENPPLKRIINYSDHNLCDRKLSPRTAPNPKTRVHK